MRIDVYSGRWPWAMAALSVVVGVTVGAFSRLLDVVVPSPSVGLAANALPMLHATLLGAIVSVAVFSLWMRSVMVGLVSSRISPRAVSAYLEDRFQHRLTWTMLAMIGTLSTLLATTPDELPEGATPPLPSTVIAVALTAAALFTVLLALRAAVWGLSVSRIVRQLAERARGLLPAEPVPVPSPQLSAPSPTRVVHTDELGWVQRVDAEALLSALPPRQRLDVLVRVGDFVTPFDPLVRLSAEVGGEDDVFRDAFDIRHGRDPEHDLAFAVLQLVDVARSALSSTSNDTSTAHEAQLHLLAVFEEMLRVGLPAHVHRDDDGREIVRPAEWAPVDHVRTAFDRLRPVAAADPVAARGMVGILERLTVAARAGDHADVLDELGRQTHRLVTSADAMLPDDLDPSDVRATVAAADLPPPPDGDFPPGTDDDDGAAPERDRDTSPQGRA